MGSYVRQGRLMVDAGFWGGVTPGNAHNASVLQGMLDAGALGFKSFMSPSGMPFFGSFGKTPYIFNELNNYYNPFTELNDSQPCCRNCYFG